MPHKIGYVDNSGGQLAHYAMLAEIKAFCEANGWQILRYDTTPENRELIMKAPGLTGTEEIYLGVRTYQNVAADYYNLVAAGFVGYIPGQSFDVQPGAILSGVPGHNQRIDYWMTINGQRLVLVMKVGTPVYESMYLGKMLPYARPSQYPYPVVVGGMLVGTAATRFSDTNHSCWVKGGFNRTTGTNVTWANMRMRFNDGVWKTPEAWPWNNTYMCGSSYSQRETGGTYPVNPVILSDATSGIFGELDGVFHITGFDNVVENTLTLEGVNHIVFQDVWRTGHNDYYVVRMDP